MHSEWQREVYATAVRYHPSVHILITGGAGFIGSHLCEALLERGKRVTAFDNFDPYYDPRVKRRNLERAMEHRAFHLVEGDIREARLLEELFARGGFTAVVHLAALAGVRESLAEPARFHEVNVGGTLNLLEAARQHGCPHFVLASTSSVYGASPRLPYREDDPLLNCVSHYGATKIACEKYAGVYQAAWGLPVTSLRFFTAYGPRQRPDMAIHRFARLMLKGGELPVYGDGTSSRDYTYIGDIVAGILGALDAPELCGVYNLGGDATTKLGELITALEQTLGVRARIKRLPEQPGDPPSTWADITRARDALGYSPQVGLAEGLKHFATWLKAEIAAGM